MIILAACVAVAASCKKENPKSSACEIIAFTVNGVDWDVSATNITHTYPTETTEGQLTPVITLSPGATVSPASGSAQNFFTQQGVSYTVTAEDGVTKKTYIAKALIQAIASGVTGDCTWALTGAADNYTLIISGNGKMADYNYTSGGANTPWYDYLNDIKTVLIQEVVTSIGGYAFYYCSGLTGPLTIPSSVTTIGYSAFSDCSGLTGPLTIPSSVTTIGDRAFYRCSGLTGPLTIGNSVTTIGTYAFWDCSGLTGTLTIPNSVTTIGYSAFSNCSGLTGTLTIGNSVTTIDQNAFSGCHFTTINVEATNSRYSSVDGVLFNKEQTILVAYPGGKNGDYSIPNSVTTIGNSAFDGCSGLNGSLTIPNSVTTIGYSAFSNCSGLTGTLTIGNSVTTIGRYAFSGCSGLTGTLTIPNSVTTIDYGAFWGCSGLTSVTNLSATPQNINSDVFSNVTVSSLTLRVPASALGAYRAAHVWKDFGTIVAI